jgi:hypothetical protein
MGRLHDLNDITVIVLNYCGTYSTVQAKLDEMAGRTPKERFVRSGPESPSVVGKYVHQEAVDVVCLTFKWAILLMA